ncbi:MAG: ketoacyl-ACP synthase III [Haliscomenobacteraceae bacterium CHB4]|nr:3-oxoacyl-[acyl-carrier-protein] synthase 3 protein 2 [Saprospiraceae bacterium]MCE7921962.1 ketoacyl-ACP synthase III [Haliscomenobacteraceae bacterium CHB4]
MTNARLTAIGMAVPEKKIDNHFFESIIETTDEWIVSRTGIRTRYHTGPDEFTSDLCVRAVQDLSDKYKVALDDVDMILVATTSPDQPMPSMACRLQYRLNLQRAGALDIYAACAGFSYGVVMAKGLIAGGTHRKILVIGAETLSKVTDFTDRTSCMLFGDGAGAVLVEADATGNIGACVTGAHGEGGIDLYISGFAKTIDGHELKMNRCIVQNGRKVFKWAVTKMSEQMKVLAGKNGLTLDQIDWFVPHSANLRIIEAISNETGFPLQKTLESIVDYGNTSSASIPIALYNGIQSGKVKRGDRIMILGFGGGLAYAGTVIRW